MNKTTTSTNKWLICYAPKPQANLRLFCFPYAGGGASVYRTWGKQLPSTIELYSIQLPGRENRLREQAFTSVSQIVNHLKPEILPFLNKPFAFFGYSLGTLIALELAQRLRPQYNPIHFFVAARNAPQTIDSKPPIHHLPDAEFVKQLINRYQGVPKEVAEHEELMALLLPMIRADITVNETYNYTSPKPLNCPITAFGGLEDTTVKQDTLAAWGELTSNLFNLHMLSGDHFFISSAQDALLSTITKILTE